MTAAAPRRLLFLCAANSARSQMAEAIARHVFGDAAIVESAGSAPTDVHALARAALAEIGLDAGGQRSKAVTDVDAARADLVITLCADEGCPVAVSPARRLHWPLPDPAAGGGSIERFRAVRDELRRRIADLRREVVSP